VTVLAVLLLTVALGAPAPAGDLQALVDATPDHGTLVLEEGRYRGGAVVDRPMTIEGRPGAVVDAGGEGTVLTVTADGVTVRGLVLRGSGVALDREDAGLRVEGSEALIEGNTLEDVLFGILLVASRDSVVAGNVVGAKDLEPGRRGDGIRLWESDRSVVRDNIVEKGRDLLFWFSTDIEITGNRVREGRYGLHFMYADSVLVADNRLEDNSVGAYLMYSTDLVFRDNVVAGNHGPSGYGLGLKDVDGVEATGNRFVANRVGVYFDGSPFTPGVVHHFSDNLIAYNDTALLFLPNVDGNVLTGNAFVDNREHVSVAGSGRLQGNTWSEDGSGNHWSDYAGYDADGDGVGDVPYRIDDLFGDTSGRHPELLLLAGSPAARVVDAAAEAFPAMRPEPRVVDDAPLVRAPLLPDPAEGTPRTGSLALLALALLGVGTVIARQARREAA